MRLLDDADDLELFSGGVSHSGAAPSAIRLFFKQPQLERLLGDNLLEHASFLAQVFNLVGGGRAGCVAGQAALAGLKELLGPGVIHAFGNAFAPAQLGDTGVTAQAIQHDADFVLGGILLPRNPADVAGQPFGW
jgi:hypothetical protein